MAFRRRGEYDAVFPTDYLYCARQIVAACDYQREALDMALVNIAAANRAHVEGAPLRAMMYRNSAAAHLRKAADHAATKRKWRRVYAEAVRNSGVASELVSPSAQPSLVGRA